MRDQFFGAKKSKSKTGAKMPRMSSQERILAKQQPDFADFKRMVDGFRVLTDLANARMQGYFGHVASFANTQKRPGSLTKAFD